MQNPAVSTEQSALSSTLLKFLSLCFIITAVVFIAALPLMLEEHRLSVGGIGGTVLFVFLVVLWLSSRIDLSAKAWVGLYALLQPIGVFATYTQGIYTFGPTLLVVSLLLTNPDRKVAKVTATVCVILFAAALGIRDETTDTALATRAIITLVLCGYCLSILFDSSVSFEAARLRLTRFLFICWIPVGATFGVLESNPAAFIAVFLIAGVVWLLFTRGQLPDAIVYPLVVAILAVLYVQTNATGQLILASLPLLILIFFLLLPAFPALVISFVALGLVSVELLNEVTQIDTDFVTRASFASVVLCALLYRLGVVRGEETPVRFSVERWFRTNQSLTALTFAGSLVIVLIAAVDEYKAKQRLVDLSLLSGDISHFERLIVDRETGQRGYLLTQNPAYLEPYEEAGRQLVPALDSIRDQLSTQNFESLIPTLDRLQRLSAERADYFQQTINFARNGSQAEALAMVSAGTGKSLTDQMRAQITQIHQSVEQAEADVRSQLFGLLNTIPVISFLTFALLFLLTRRQAHTLRQRVTDPLQRLSQALGHFSPNNSQPLELRETGQEVEEITSLVTTSRSMVQSVNDTRGRLLASEAQLLAQNHELELEIDKFDTVCDQLQMSYWRLKLEDNSITYNRTFATRWGLEVSGTTTLETLPSFMHAEYVDFHQRAIARVVATGETHRVRHQATAQSRAGRWFELTYWPSFNADNTVAMINVANIEITDKVFAEQALLQRSAEIEAARKELQKALEELQLKNEKQRELFAIIGHELRTPLASMSMMQDEMELQNIEPYGRSLVDSTAALLSILDDLRTVVNPERVKAIAAVTDSPRKVVERTLAALGGLLLEHKKELHLTLGDNTDHICLFHAQALRQITTNLVKNAVIHSGGSEIWVGLTSLSQSTVSVELLLTVDDNGKGIPEESRAALFESFSRGDTQADGTGLGLFIVDELSDLLRGSVACKDSPQGGARFEIRMRLDLYSQQFKTQPQSLESSDSDAPAEDLLKGRRILVAEDQKTIQMMTQKMLEREGAEVIVADDGAAALERFDGKIDIVLTDIMMPELDGYGLTTELRAKGFSGPILGITAAVVGEETEHLMRCGANAALSKPLRLAELKARLAEIMEGQS